MTAAPPDLVSLSMLFDRYSILETLHADVPFVFLVQHKASGRDALLHLVPNEQATLAGWDDAFMDAASRAVKLQHPHLIGVEDAGEKGGYRYVIVEQVKEARMKQLSSQIPLSPRDAVQCVQGLALAMAHAHAQGIVHGRIDVTVISVNSRHFCRILPIDLRPSRVLPDLREFYAPEALAERGQGRSAADTYSLGVVLYWLLTGGLPSQRKHLMPSCVGSSSRELDALVARAMAGRPEQRFESLSGMVEDLENLEPEAVQDANKAARKAARRVVMVDKGEPLTYFYLIPLLLVAICVAYIVMVYKYDVAQLRKDYNKARTEYNEEVLRRNSGRLLERGLP